MLLRAISVVPPPMPDVWRSRKLKPSSAHGSSGSVAAALGPASSSAMVLLRCCDDRGHQPGDRRAVLREHARAHAGGDALGQRRPRRSQHGGLADQLEGARLVEVTGGVGQLDQRVTAVGRTSGLHGPGHVRRAAAHGVLLVEHPAGADGPALVDVADAVGVGHPEVGDELLAELLGAVDHLDPVQLDAGLVDLDDEHAEAHGAWARPSWCAAGTGRSRRTTRRSSRSSSR